MRAFQTFEKKLNSFKSWLLNYKVRIFLIMLLYPNIVCYTPDSNDTSNTVIDFLLGIGKYANVTYNCEGQATSISKYSFFDYGGSVSHNIDKFKFGVRGGGYSIKDNGKTDTYDNFLPYYGATTIGDYSTQYINPFIGFDHKYFELNIGLLLLSERNYEGGGGVSKYFISEGKVQPSWFLRIGNEENIFFSTEYLSNLPLLSGGGMLDAGLGFGSTESRKLTWLGASIGPFQHLGLVLKQNIQITDDIDILLKGRVGIIESAFEGGISGGVRLNL